MDVCIALYPSISRFIEDSDIYHCRKVRSVDEDPPADDTLPVASGFGDLTYNMDIVVGEPGGDSEITISPNFDFPGISAR